VRHSPGIPLGDSRGETRGLCDLGRGWARGGESPGGGWVAGRQVRGGEASLWGRPGWGPVGRRARAAGAVERVEGAPVRVAE